MISTSKHRAILLSVFVIYAISTWTSRAGIEIFGPLSSLIGITYFIRTKDTEIFRNLARIYPWKIIAGLLFITALGLIVNGPTKANLVKPLLSQSYMIYFFFWAALFCKFKFDRKYLFGSLTLIGLLALYAFSQSFTGIDLLRPGQIRAVIPVGDGRDGLFRSAGTLDNAIYYATVAGLQACIIFAFLPMIKKNFGITLFYFAALVGSIVFASVITSYTRSAWASLPVALVAMTYLIKPKAAVKTAIAGIFIVCCLLSVSSAFRSRSQSVFDSSNSSNSYRVVLWKLNWKMFLDHPVLGVGYLQSEIRAPEYASKIDQPVEFISHSHSNYLEMLSSTGLAGFTLFLMLIIYMLKITLELFRLAKPQSWWKAFSIGAFGAQIHFHLGGFTDVTIRALPSIHTLMLIWGAVLAGHYINSRQQLKVGARLSTI